MCDLFRGLGLRREVEEPLREVGALEDAVREAFLVETRKAWFGVTLTRLGVGCAARAVLEDATRAYPGSEVIARDLGVALFHEGRYRSAYRHLRRIALKRCRTRPAGAVEAVGLWFDAANALRQHSGPLAPAWLLIRRCWWPLWRHGFPASHRRGSVLRGLGKMPVLPRRVRVALLRRAEGDFNLVGDRFAIAAVRRDLARLGEEVESLWGRAAGVSGAAVVMRLYGHLADVTGETNAMRDRCKQLLKLHRRGGDPDLVRQARREARRLCCRTLRWHDIPGQAKALEQLGEVESRREHPLQSALLLEASWQKYRQLETAPWIAWTYWTRLRARRARDTLRFLAKVKSRRARSALFSRRERPPPGV